MNVPPNDSFAWPVLLVLMLGAVYGIIAEFGSRNGFDVEADGRAIIGLIGTVIVFALGKRAAVGPQEPK